jgi:outer membrane biosynthesis protein TonB
MDPGLEALSQEGCMPVPTGLPEVLFPPAAAQVEANEEAKMGTPKRFRLVPEQTKKPKETKAKKSEPRKPKETQTKKPKEPKETKQRAKRQTKKEQDEQAVNQFLASPAWEAEVDKQRKSAKLDRVYKKAEKVMKEFALLGDGNPEQLAEEKDCLVTCMGKMVELQLKRKRQLSAASNMAEINAAYSRIKHAPLQRIV